MARSTLWRGYRLRTSARSRPPGFWPVRRAEFRYPGPRCISAISAPSSNHPLANVPSRRRLATYSFVACTSDTVRSYRRSRRSTPSPDGSCRFNRWRRRRRRSQPDDQERGYRQGTPGTPDRRRNSRLRLIWRPRLRADRAARASAVKTPRSRTRARGAVARSPSGDHRPTGRPRRPWWVAGWNFRIRPRWVIRTYKMP